MWGGFLASLLALADCYDAVREQVQKNMSAAKDTTESTSIKGTSVGLCAAAVVVLLACCRDVRNEAVFGLISSVVTILITIVFIFVKDIEEKQAKVVDAFVFCLLILWIATAGVLTFRYFILTGNPIVCSSPSLPPSLPPSLCASVLGARLTGLVVG